MRRIGMKREFRENRDEDTSSTTRADRSWLRASGSDQVPTEGALDQVARMSRQVLGGESRDTGPQSDQAEKITDISNDSSECDKQYHTLDRQSGAMLQSETYSHFLSPHQRMDLENQREFTERYYQTYASLKSGPYDLARFTAVHSLEADLKRHQTELTQICRVMKQKLWNDYKIRLSKAEIVEGLEKRLYQEVDTILQHTRNDKQSEESEKLLCALVNESEKATGESDEGVAQTMIAEKLVAMLDNKKLSQEARQSLLKPLSLLGARNENVAGRVAK